MSPSRSLSQEGGQFSRNIDWNLFKVFCQIARSGSIGAAAKALNRQQPSISAALKRLESHVGVPLCIRSHRGITLTAFGQHLLSTCEDMRSSIEQLPQAASTAKQEASPPITLSIISNLHLVPQLNSIFIEFHHRHPMTKIKLNVLPWRTVLKSITEGDVEIGVGFMSGDVPDPLISLPITSQVQQLYCGPGHKFHGHLKYNALSLQSEPFVISTDELPPDKQYRERCGLGRKIGGISDNLIERMWLIRLGMGIGFLPKPIVDASSFSEELWPLLPENKAPVGTICLISKTRSIRNAQVRVLWDVARRHLKTKESAAVVAHLA